MILNYNEYKLDRQSIDYVILLLRKQMKSRVTYLDGLRGIAALVVVLNHYAWSFYPAIFTRSIEELHSKTKIESFIYNSYNSPLGIVLNGTFAVCLFLVLSGFLVSFKYFKKQELNS